MTVFLTFGRTAFSSSNILTLNSNQYPTSKPVFKTCFRTLGKMKYIITLTLVDITDAKS